MRVSSVLRLATFVLAVSTISGPAGAQLNNAAPYSFPGSSASGAISPAYRQAILQQKILGSRPSQLQLDTSGALLNVQSAFGGQSFASYPQTVYLTSGSGLGLGFGGGGGVDSSYSPIYSGAQGAPVINAWIAQLDGLK